MFRNTGVELGGDSVHLSSPLDNFKHHQSLASGQLALRKELVTLTDQFLEKISKIQLDVDQVEQLRKENNEVITSKVMELKSQVESVRKRVTKEPESTPADNSNLLARIKRLEQQEANNQQVIKSQKKEIGELRAELFAFKREYHQQQQRTSHSGGLAPRHTSVSGRETHGTYVHAYLQTATVEEVVDVIVFCFFFISWPHTALVYAKYEHVCW